MDSTGMGRARSASTAQKKSRRLGKQCGLKPGEKQEYGSTEEQLAPPGNQLISHMLVSHMLISHMLSLVAVLPSSQARPEAACRAAIKTRHAFTKQSAAVETQSFIPPGTRIKLGS